MQLSGIEKGAVIQIHDETGIVLDVDGGHLLTLWQNGRKEWVLFLNHHATLKIIADKKCP